MVDARLEGQRLRLGVHAVNDLTSAYEIRLFPIQTDQDSFATPWLVRTRDTIPPKRARLTKALDATYREDGDYTFQLGFSFWTFDMAKYWNVTLLGGAASAVVSTMVYDIYNEPIFLKATTRKLFFPGDGQPYPGGWRDVIVPFEAGKIITV